MRKINSIFFLLKDKFLSLLVFCLAIFCLINIVINHDDNLTVISNALAVILVLIYFFNFEKKFFSEIVIEKLKNSRMQLFRSFYQKRWLITHLFFIIFILLVTFNPLLNFNWLNKYQALVVVLTIGFGCLTFWHNSERVLKEIKMEKNREENFENQRKQFFNKKFVLISNLDWQINLKIYWKNKNYFKYVFYLFLSPLIFLIRIPYVIIRWMYKEGWKYSIVLLLLLIIGIATRFYGLGDYDLRDDELFVNSVAYNYLQEGDFYKWDWIHDTSGKNTDCLEVDPYCNYTRGWPYTLTVVPAYWLLGVSEFSTRLPGALFGVISILVIYFIAKFFIKNKNFALLAAFLFTFSPVMIQWSRFPRMYSLLIPVFSLTVYFVYRAIDEKRAYKFNNKILSQIVKTLDFNYTFILWSFFLLWLSCVLHVGAFILVPFIILFIFIKFLFTKEKRYLYLLFIIFIIPALFFFIFKPIFDLIIEQILQWGAPGYRIRYMDYLLEYPLTKSLSFLWILISSVFAVTQYKHKLPLRFFYLLMIVGGSLLTYTFIMKTGLFIDSRYISFVVPMAFILICLAAFLIIKTVNNRVFSIVFVLLIMLITLVAFFDFSKKYYNFNNYPQLRQAYQIIKNNYQPGELVISNSLRAYYLWGLKTEDIYKMEWRMGYSFDEFMSRIMLYDSGWLVWEVDKVEMHIRPEIYNYAENNFTKYHGTGIDDTGVDVYYFDRNSLQGAGSLINVDRQSN